MDTKRKTVVFGAPMVLFGGVNIISSNTGTILARGTDWSITVSIVGKEDIVELPTPTAVPTPTPVPSATPSPDLDYWGSQGD
jgi:hypothetical protein